MSPAADLRHTRRLLLVRHAMTDATRARAFPADEELDEPGLCQAARLPAALDGVAAEGEVLSSPARRCRQTAAAAGLSPRTERALAECDFGAWAGLTLRQVHERTPADVQRWMTDPDVRPGGGESLTELAARVGRWLDGQFDRSGPAVAITHGGVIRAAVTHALSAPLQAIWRIAVDPASVTELSARDGAWTVVRVNAGTGPNA